MSAPDEGTDFLRIYLEDHHAGATAGAHRAGRLAEAEASSPDAAVLATFADDVSADLDALVLVMDTLGIKANRAKAGIAAVAEKVGALKPNGRLFERSPLSTIVELEAMQMAVRGKRSLWETLQATIPGDPPLDFTSLIERADDQLARLSALHARRVPVTFARAVAPGRDVH